jgi:hypothetical protein
MNQMFLTAGGVIIAYIAIEAGKYGVNHPGTAIDAFFLILKLFGAWLTWIVIKQAYDDFIESLKKRWSRTRRQVS